MQFYTIAATYKKAIWPDSSVNRRRCNGFVRFHVTKTTFKRIFINQITKYISRIFCGPLNYHLLPAQPIDLNKTVIDQLPKISKELIALS